MRPTAEDKGVKLSMRANASSDTIDGDPRIFVSGMTLEFGVRDRGERCRGWHGGSAR